MHVSAAALEPPLITPSDRLGMTIVLAIILHAMLVLGVSFSPEPIPEARYESLEIILVTQQSETPPEEADALAQADLQGGADSDEFERPATPVIAPIPAAEPEVTASAAAPAEPQPTPDDTIDKLHQTTGEDQLAEDAKQSQQPEQLVEEVALADNPSPQPEAKPQPPAPTTETETTQAPAKIEIPVLPSAARLITRSFALASLNAELQQKLDMRSKRPRHKYITANTRQNIYAAYMAAWLAKVERVGNQNYPDLAKKNKIFGSLMLDVALNPDGTVREISLRKPSGYKVLDDAAIRSVELASPYMAFPDEIRKEVDVLHITRTWRYRKE